MLLTMIQIPKQMLAKILKLTIIIVFPFLLATCGSIHSVSKHGTPEQIAAILKTGSKMNAQDNKGRTPLITAAWYENK